MKKNFLFAAVALAAMTSCSNDEVVNVNNGDAISFRASLDKAISRGAETNLQNLKAFNVTAVGNGNNYFTNLGVTSDDQGSNWNTVATYYWPSFNLQFFAYAPQTEIGTVNITNTEQKIVGFTPKSNVAEQQDLVVAYNTGTRDSNQDKGVALNFKHALSQIEVKAKCLNPNIKIEVKGVRIVNVATVADFTFPREETNLSYSLLQGQWDNRSGENILDNAYKIEGKSSIILNNESQSIMFNEGNFMLIPQQLTKWGENNTKTGAYLSVLCRISSKDGDKEVLLYPLATTEDAKIGKYAYSAVAIGTNWLPGKKYTYTLTFCGEDGGAGRVDPNPDTEEPNPLPGKEGGDLILGKPIKFTVTVDDWSPVEENITMG